MLLTVYRVYQIAVLCRLSEACDLSTGDFPNRAHWTIPRSAESSFNIVVSGVVSNAIGTFAIPSSVCPSNTRAIDRSLIIYYERIYRYEMSTLSETVLSD